MKYKFFVAAAVLFLLTGAAFAQVKTKNSLAAQLPASDGVLTLDVQRLLNETMPQILSGKPQTLNGINQKIDELRDKTGLDARQFEQLAVGVAMKTVSAKEVDLEPVFLARGKYSSGALIAVAKLAANGKYREEKLGSRTIYVFTGREIVNQNKPQSKGSFFDRMIERMIEGLTKEIAVASFDDNTLVFGALARVRETFETKPRVSNQILSLAQKKPGAVLSFGARLPNGLSNFVDLDNDELGTTLDSIRQMSGALEVANNTTNLSLTAKTATAEQAQSLHETLEGLQMLGKAFLGGSTAEKKVYVRMIDSLRLTRNLSEVMIDLQVPQSDINILLANVK